MNASHEPEAKPDERPAQPRPKEGREAAQPEAGDFALSAHKPGRAASPPPWVEPVADEGVQPDEDTEFGENAEPDQPREPALDERRFQFSLVELLALAIAASLLCSVAVTLSGDSVSLCAGLLGLVVLVGLVVLEAMRITRPILRVAWWVALGIYLLACAVAVLRG